MRTTKKASGKRKLVSQCDVLVRQLVLHRDGYKCVRCEGNNVLQAAHILSKGCNGRIRFDLLNVLTMCLRCHLYWAHRDPVGFVDWVEKQFPGRLQQLRIMAATAARLDLKELLIGLRLDVEELDPPSKTILPDLECAKNLLF